VVGFTTGSRGEVPWKKENLDKRIIIIIIIRFPTKAAILGSSMVCRFAW
jgi:hypothetical protein